MRILLSFVEYLNALHLPKQLTFIIIEFTCLYYVGRGFYFFNISFKAFGLSSFWYLILLLVDLTGI